MKKIIIFSISICLICFGIFNINNKENNELYKLDTINKEENTLSMMLETEFNSGEYKKTTASAWPTEDYVFNSTLSKCKNGSNLSWDSDKKQVIFDGINKDECYVYFDKEPSYLYKYIKKLYTGVQGENNLYYHDSTLENGAGDNSYRYAGSSETTNNFVCFGYDSTDGSCPTDNLYRIIGVFENQVKLIKYDYALSDLLGTDGCAAMSYSKTDKGGTSKGENTNIYAYHWYTSNYPSNNWKGSCLNETNLNINFLNNIGDKWEKMIYINNWKIGGNYKSNIYRIPSEVYENEILRSDTTYDAKVGLMYISDYGFAAAPSAWKTLLYNPSTNDDYANSDIISVNWMYMGLWEWTITPSVDTRIGVFLVMAEGNIIGDYNSYKNHLAIRPTFYLNSDITYVSGKGTKTEPILIK